MSFLASKGFLVGATVAAFVVAGSAVAWYTATKDGAFAVTTSDCGSVFGGRALDADVIDTGASGGALRRVVTFKVNVSDLEGGDLRACTSVGDVEVSPSEDGQAQVVFLIEGQDEGDRDLVRDAKVTAVFVEEAGGLLLVAEHEATREENRGGHSLQVSVRVRVPASGPYAFDLATGVGDLHLDGFLAEKISASTGVGDIDLMGIDSKGDVEAETGVGDVEIDLMSVESSHVTARTGTGDVFLAIPERPDVGYDAYASTGVGRIEVDVGPTDTYDKSESNVGGDVHARSKGFADRPVQVRIDANTGVGDVAVLS